MSIQTYNKDLIWQDQQVDHSTGELTPATPTDAIGMEFQMDLLVTRGLDKVQKKSTQFTVVGEGSYSASSYADLFQAGAIIASTIAKLSKGVMCGFFAKLGKFRSDEIPTDIPTGDNSYCALVLTNDYHAGYGNNPCNNTNLYPYKKATSNLYIPWFRDDLSRQDVIQTFANIQQTINGVTYRLGQLRFADANKTTIEALPTQFVKDITVKNRSYSLPDFKINNDSALGMNDNVVSEEYNDVSSAGRDDGELNQ